MEINKPENTNPLLLILNILFRQLLNLFRYSQMVPMIMLNFMMIFLLLFALAVIFITISKGSLEPLYNLPWLGKLMPTNLNLELAVPGTKEILKIYAWGSFICYLIGSLISYVFKIKIALSFKQKMKTAIFTPFLSYIFIFLVFWFIILADHKEQSMSFLIIFIVLFIATSLANMYSIFINKIVDSIEEKLFNISKSIL